MSSDSGPELEVGVLAEEVRQYATYSAASVASCNWVNSGRDKIDPSKLQLYVSRMQVSPAFGKVVGVGLQGTSTVIPYVRLDMDNTGKGIHFNATQLTDTSKKLAAVLTPSVSLTDPQRTSLYLDYIKGIENRSAQFIWQWWSTGIPPS